MKNELMNYEACEIEILPLTDIVTSSSGFDGIIDQFKFSFNGGNNSASGSDYEW